MFAGDELWHVSPCRDQCAVSRQQQPLSSQSLSQSLRPSPSCTAITSADNNNYNYISIIPHFFQILRQWCQHSMKLCWWRRQSDAINGSAIHDVKLTITRVTQQDAQLSSRFPWHHASKVSNSRHPMGSCEWGSTGLKMPRDGDCFRPVK